MKSKPPQIDRLEFKRLSLGFPGHELLSEVDFQFPEGKVVRILGQSGSGKSSVLKVLVGLLSPLGGEFMINGQSVGDMSFEDFLPYRLSIGYGFEMGGLLNNRTLAENLALPLLYHQMFEAGEVAARVREITTAFKLEKVANERPSAVSGSQRKAVCVARAFMMNPQVLILDNPTVGLGVEAVQALYQLIDSKLKDGSLRFVIVASDNRSFLRDLPVVDVDLVDLRMCSENKTSSQRVA